MTRFDTWGNERKGHAAVLRNFEEKPQFQKLATNPLEVEVEVEIPNN